jgi:hypothetical protein
MALDPGRPSAPRIACRTCCLRANRNSRPLRYLIFRGSIPHPCNRCVRFATTVASGHANTRYQADATPYLGRTSTGWTAPACGWRTYSIASSAMASSVAGTSRPSALAVLRLIASANLVGCSIARSLGFAPRRILSTYSAARRNRSWKSTP